MIATAGKDVLLLRPMRAGLIHATDSGQADGVMFCGRKQRGWIVATDRSWLVEQWCALCLARAVPR